jgi:hypothetical protein
MGAAVKLASRKAEGGRQSEVNLRVVQTFRSAM